MTLQTITEDELDIPLNPEFTPAMGADPVFTFGQKAEAIFEDDHIWMGAFNSTDNPRPLRSEEDVARHKSYVSNYIPFIEQHIEDNELDIDITPHMSYLDGSQNEADALWHLNNVINRTKRMEIIESMPWYEQMGLYGMSALTSPENYIPFAGPAIRAGRLARGASIAAQQFGIEGMAEVARHGQQPLRTGFESAMNIGLTSGIAFPLGMLGKGAKGLDDLPPNQIQTPPTSSTAIDASAGAQQRYQYIPQERVNEIMADPNLSDAQKRVQIIEEDAAPTALKGGKAVRTLMKVFSLGFIDRMHPEVDAKLNGGAVAMKTAENTYNTGVKSKGAYGTSLEARMQLEERIARRQIGDDLKTNFAEYKRGGGRFDETVWQREVHNALTQGDVGMDALITASARQVRENYKDMVAWMEKEKFLDESLTLATKADDISHAVRQYDLQAPLSHTLDEYQAKFHIANRNAADADVAGLFDDLMKAVNKKLDKEWSEKLAKAMHNLRNRHAKNQKLSRKQKLGQEATLTKKYGRDKIAARDRKKVTVQEQVEKRREKGFADRVSIVKGMYEGRRERASTADYSNTGLVIKHDGDGYAETIKVRSLRVKTSDIDPSVLSKEPLADMARYFAQIRTVKAMWDDPLRRGDINFEKELLENKNLYDDKLTILKEKGAAEDSSAVKNLEKQRVADVQRIQLARDRATGRTADKSGLSAKQSNALAGLQMANAAQMLGSVIFSVAGEWAAPIKAAGVRSTIQAMMGHLFATPAQRAMFKANAAEWQYAANSALAITMGTDSARFMDVSRLNNQAGPALRRLEKITGTIVGKVDLLNPATDAVEAFTAHALDNNITKLLRKKKLSARDMEELREIGIDPKLVGAYQKQVAQHSADLPANGSTMNISAWDDKYLAKEMSATMHGQVRGNVLTHSWGASPRIMDNKLMSIPMQFKRYMMMSSAKYYLPLVQGVATGDYRVTAAAIVSTSLVTLSTMGKEYMMGRDPLEGYGTPEWTAKTMGNALHYASFFGAMGQISNAMEAITTFSPEDLIHRGARLPTSWAGGRNAASFFGGPSAGRLQDLFQVGSIFGNAIDDKKMTKSQAVALEKMFNPLFSFYGYRTGKALMGVDSTEFIQEQFNE